MSDPSKTAAGGEADNIGRDLASRHSLAQWEAENKFRLANADAKTRIALEEFRVVIDASKEAINAALLVNGGAVIAILGFIGSVVTKTGPAHMTGMGSLLSAVMLQFAGGVVCAALAFGLRYCAQLFYRTRRKIPRAKKFHFAAVIAVIASYAAFGYGAWNCYNAFNIFFGTPS
jgi:hypothetical protein